MAKVLVVEDDKDLAQTVSAALALESHLVEVFHDGKEGLARMMQGHFDLAVLDWTLPGMPGVEAVKLYRASGGGLPILMLTGRSEIDDKMKGFTSGADDYLTKPFAMTELCLRVAALLRRPQQMTSCVLKSRNIELDQTSKRVTKCGVDVELVAKEYAVFEFLMRHPGKVYSAESLIQHVWQTGTDVSPEALRNVIVRIRRKLDDDPDNSIIRTLPKLGYRLEQ
ncbi:MAG TPA: response regulator transcription factor [Trichormus sp.]|jgi:DNA-binding response OmpR family regulator